MGCGRAGSSPQSGLLVEICPRTMVAGAGRASPSQAGRGHGKKRERAPALGLSGVMGSQVSLALGH